MSPKIVPGDIRRSPVPNPRTSTTSGAAVSETCRSPSGKGSPYLVSGELFLRSTPQLFARAEENDVKASSAVVTIQDSRRARRRSPASFPINREAAATAGHNQNSSAGLLGDVSKDLRDLLLCHPDPHRDRGDRERGEFGRKLDSLELVSQAREARRLARVQLIKQLKASKTVVECMVTARLSAAKEAAGTFRAGCNDCRTKLDERLGNLVLRYASTIREEMAKEDAQTTVEGEHCNKEQERLELAARLAALAATAEYRTRGGVVLRRLPQTHPQHSRCLRAATENVKDGFFSKADSPYGAVRVLDIYKIENRFLLERFQRAAEETDPCKVKGLFCHVPFDSLEHVVMFGMGAPDNRESGGNDYGDDSLFRHELSAVDPSTAKESRRREKSGARVETTSGSSTGKNVVRAEGGSRSSRNVNGKPLEFPRAFSRYSTLEEERDYANAWRGNVRLHEDGSPDVVRNTKSSSTGSCRTELDQSGPGGDHASGLRLLALCRIMISGMHLSFSPVSDYRSGEKSAATSPDDACIGSDDFRDSLTESPREQSFPTDLLPRPKAGQPEYDAVYFPRDEEYLLLNRAFVLPEFLVVHRFVSIPHSPTAPTTVNPCSNKSISSTGAEPHGLLRDILRVDSEISTSVVDSSPRQPSSPSLSSGATAGSVVTEMISATHRCYQDHQKGTWGGVAGGVPGTAAPRMVLESPRQGHCGYYRGPGSGVPSSLSSSRWNVDSPPGGAVALNAHRGQERGCERKKREMIERAFELAFDAYHKEVTRLRDAQHEEIKENATRSRVLSVLGGRH